MVKPRHLVNSTYSVTILCTCPRLFLVAGKDRHARPYVRQGIMGAPSSVVLYYYAGAPQKASGATSADVHACRGL